MSWSRIVTVTCLFWLAGGTAARAEWHDWFHQFWADARRMNAWPDPFRGVDREATRAPFELMADRGWQVEHTLVDALFTAEGDLTYAGKLRVKNIVTQAPVHRRSVWVVRADSPEVTERRLEAVEKHVSEVAVDGIVAPVLLTDRVPRLGTGDYMHQVSRKHREFIPPPVLPGQDGTTGGGGAEQ